MHLLILSSFTRSAVSPRSMPRGSQQLSFSVGCVAQWYVERRSVTSELSLSYLQLMGNHLYG